MLGVHDGDDRVQGRLGAHVLVDEEGLCDGSRVGQACGLDDDAVEAVLALQQRVHDPDQVAAHGAADAAVVHLEHLLVAVDDEVVVDAEFAELVDDNGVLLAVLLAQDAVQQGRLPAPRYPVRTVTGICGCGISSSLVSLAAGRKAFAGGMCRCNDIVLHLFPPPRSPDMDVECQCQIEATLNAVAGHCRTKGWRFTGLRREVLGLVLTAEGPVGAYGLLDRVRPSRAGAAPPTVYRALSFLLAKGLHRVERLNAFVACTAAHPHDTPAHLLICRAFGKVTEVGDSLLSGQLTSSAEAAGFTTLAATHRVGGHLRALHGIRGLAARSRRCAQTEAQETRDRGDARHQVGRPAQCGDPEARRPVRPVCECHPAPCLGECQPDGERDARTEAGREPLCRCRRTDLSVNTSRTPTIWAHSATARATTARNSTEISRSDSPRASASSGWRLAKSSGRAMNASAARLTAPRPSRVQRVGTFHPEHVAEQQGSGLRRKRGEDVQEKKPESERDRQHDTDADVPLLDLVAEQTHADPAQDGHQHQSPERRHVDQDGSGRSCKADMGQSVSGECLAPQHEEIADRPRDDRHDRSRMKAFCMKSNSSMVGVPVRTAMLVLMVVPLDLVRTRHDEDAPVQMHHLDLRAVETRQYRAGDLRHVAHGRISACGRCTENADAPGEGRSRPRTARIIVVFPAPFGPSTPMNAFSGMARSTPARIPRPAQRERDAFELDGVQGAGFASAASSASSCDVIQVW